MNKIWKHRGELNVGKYRISFMSLYENEYDRDPMCDCVGKLMVPAGKYQVEIRDRNESTAASAILHVDTTKDFGNQMYRVIRRMGSDEKKLESYIAYIAYNILKNGRDFFKIYQDKYSGYYDGKVANEHSVEEMRRIIRNYPVQKCTWEV